MTMKAAEVQEPPTGEALTTRIFVKYANRKIHELGHRSAYISMEDLLGLVSSGVQVRVIEDVTGHDMTAYVFSRLVYDRCRMDKNAYRADELQRLIMSNPPPKKKEAA